MPAARDLKLGSHHFDPPPQDCSLALLEPAWAGNWDWSPGHTELWKKYDQLDELPPAEFMTAFMRLGVTADVVLPPPPPGPPPSWMAKRPAGIGAFIRTFKSYSLDRGRLTAFARPVLFILGGKSNPADYADNARRLSRVFPDFRLEVFPDRHHFDPPHRAEPQRDAALLHEHWERAESDL
jgi:hypothetical protein